MVPEAPGATQQTNFGAFRSMEGWKLPEKKNETDMGGNPKIRGNTPKWMVEKYGNPLFLNGCFGGKPTIFGNIPCVTMIVKPYLIFQKRFHAYWLSYLGPQAWKPIWNHHYRMYHQWCQVFPHLQLLEIGCQVWRRLRLKFNSSPLENDDPFLQRARPIFRGELFNFQGVTVCMCVFS